MEDPDQVDDRLLAARKLLENAASADVRFDDVDGGEKDQMLGALAAPRRHGYVDAAPRELRDQMTPYEAGSPDNQDVIELHQGRSSSTGSAGPRGAMVPSRALIGTGRFSISAA